MQVITRSLIVGAAVYGASIASKKPLGPLFYIGVFVGSLL